MKKRKVSRLWRLAVSWGSRAQLSVGDNHNFYLQEAREESIRPGARQIFPNCGELRDSGRPLVYSTEYRCFVQDKRDKVPQIVECTGCVTVCHGFGELTLECFSHFAVGICWWVSKRVLRKWCRIKYNKNVCWCGSNHYLRTPWKYQIAAKPKSNICIIMKTFLFRHGTGIPTSVALAKYRFSFQT